MTEKKHVDLSYLRNISMGDDALILEMIDLFLEKAPKMLDDMEEAYKEEDWEQVAAVTHRFKPNLDYMGMAGARELIEEMEADVKNRERLETFGKRLQMLRQRCLDAYELLNEERSHLKKS